MLYTSCLCIHAVNLPHALILALPTLPPPPPGPTTAARCPCQVSRAKRLSCCSSTPRPARLAAPRRHASSGTSLTVSRRSAPRCSASHRIMVADSWRCPTSPNQ
eukprot:356634-Chlamydomonas_euryale.AAC.5